MSTVSVRRLYRKAKPETWNLDLMLKKAEGRWLLSARYWSKTWDMKLGSLADDQLKIRQKSFQIWMMVVSQADDCGWSRQNLVLKCPALEGEVRPEEVSSYIIKNLLEDAERKLVRNSWLSICSLEMASQVVCRKFINLQENAEWLLMIVAWDGLISIGSPSIASRVFVAQGWLLKSSWLMCAKWYCWQIFYLTFRV